MATTTLIRDIDKWLNVDPDTPEGEVRRVYGGRAIPGLNYFLREELGKGGTGVVWGAVAPGRIPVAIKYVPLWTALGRKEREVMRDIIRKVRHANLLAVHATYLLAGDQLCVEEQLHRADTLAVVMELADCTLENVRVACGGRIEAAELLGYMAEAAKPLDYLVRQQVQTDDKAGRFLQHGDIKPDNIFRVGDAVALGDFTTLWVLMNTETEASGASTPLYAAPETFFEKRITKSSDQFSLAVTFCKLLTGQDVFGPDRRLARRPEHERPRLDAVPPEFLPAVRRALSPEPRDRWPTCEEFVAQLTRPPAAEAVRPTRGEELDRYCEAVRAGRAAAIDGFRAAEVGDAEAARLHADAYAREFRLDRTRVVAGITFVLVPPATTRPQGTGATSGPPVDSHFWMSEHPLTLGECRRLGAVAAAGWTKAGLYAWFQKAKESFGPGLRACRFQDLRHADRLGFRPVRDGVDAELCQLDGAWHVVTRSAAEESLPVNELGDGTGCRLILEDS